MIMAGFFNTFAAGNPPAISKADLPMVWQNADWLKVLTVFDLEPQKHKNNEIWIKSPFSDEKNASLHMHSGKNVYKDFSSGKGGGILNFCQDLLALRGKQMNCYEVAEWMVDQGVSILNQTAAVGQKPAQKQNSANLPVAVDLQPYLQSSHPVLEKRGISGQACRYLGCGYLPEREQGKRSPLNGRLVFQVRGVNHSFNDTLKRCVEPCWPCIDNRNSRQPTAGIGVLPFSKKLEIYNQDKLLLDPGAKKQLLSNTACYCPCGRLL